MRTRSITLVMTAAVLLLVTNLKAQQNQDSSHYRTPARRVVITGARFCYPLLQRWIERYKLTRPEVEVVIEPRSTRDPESYDILAEVYDHNPEVKATRAYAYVGRYAVLPVANAASAFARTYAISGVSRDQIRQLFFRDTFADQEKLREVQETTTIYTRLQKAGAPIVFATQYGFTQTDFKGKAIAGADEHLLTAILRDTTAVSYLPLPLIYDLTTRSIKSGLAVLPVDLDGNGKISDTEKQYHELDDVIAQLESLADRGRKNIALAHFHLSVAREHADPEAVDFIRWVVDNGQADLHEEGFMEPAAENPN